MASLVKSTGTTAGLATAVAAGVAVAAAQPLLLNFDALPAWLQDNAFILTGYRRRVPIPGPACRCLAYPARVALLHCTDETNHLIQFVGHSILGRDVRARSSDIFITKVVRVFLPDVPSPVDTEFLLVNIHTHLFGALVLLYLLLNVGKTQANYTTLTWHDPVGFSLSLMAGVFCLGASALYHTATCHSPNVARRCNALDYSGIIVLTVGSFYPCLRYGFFCDPQYQVMYSLGITVAGLVAAYVVLNPQYSTPAYRWARTSVFFLLGACSFVPIATAYHLYGLERMKNEMGVQWIALTAVLYVSGAFIYACRVPERWFPGTFDLFGSSHQIFHVCVVLAALSHYQAVLTGFEYWHGQHHGVCPS